MSVEAFEVEEHAVALPDEPVKIKLADPPRKVLGHELEVGVAEVPLYLAVYLVSNGGGRFEVLL